MINYDNITLVPRVISEVKSREDVSTAVDLGNLKLDIPIIASPMPDVCGAYTAFILRRCGALGIIHRFQTIEGQMREYIDSTLAPETASRIDVENRYSELPPVACAIGVSDDYEKRFDALYRIGCRIFCLDTANGANIKVKHAVEELRSRGENLYIIAGNVATVEGFQFLADIEVNAVRVGIAGGSVCETKIETGVHMPTLESVQECYGYASIQEEAPMIIADGGIRTPSDMAKALAVGADAVMGGRIFAGYKESPGKIVKDRAGIMYKLYRGAASHSVQKENNGEKPDYAEGAEELVPYIDKSVADVVRRFKNGLRSTMSYMNATTIAQFKSNVRVEKV